MRRRKKVALVMLCALVVSQAPFAWRRYRLGRLAGAVRELNARRVEAPLEDSFAERVGVFHVHSALGGHSTGQPAEIVRAARDNRLDFVVMTEHPSGGLDTAGATLKGSHEGVLFLNGSELVAAGGERLFVVPGFAPPVPSADALALPELIARAKREGRLAFIAYPELVRDWRVQGFDGIEVYNLYTNAKGISYPLLFFDGLWSYGSYPELLFATFYERPGDALKSWDEVNAGGARRASAVAGNDAHANVGFSLSWPGGGELFELWLDPYERSFRVVRNHVLVERGTPFDTEALAGALGRGRSYIAFDLFCDARGFRLTAENDSGRRTMGEEISLSGGPVIFTALTPVKARVLFFRDGRVVGEGNAALRHEFSAETPGAYRVEVYLDELGDFLEGKPWIISNPIYVR